MGPPLGRHFPIGPDVLSRRLELVSLLDVVLQGGVGDKLIVADAAIILTSVPQVILDGFHILPVLVDFINAISCRLLVGLGDDLMSLYSLRL